MEKIYLATYLRRFFARKPAAAGGSGPRFVARARRPSSASVSPYPSGGVIGLVRGRRGLDMGCGVQRRHEWTAGDLSCLAARKGCEINAVNSKKRRNFCANEADKSGPAFCICAFGCGGLDGQAGQYAKKFREFLRYVTIIL
ncbi:MAG TPA: hypothetical protein VHE54_07195 [Puia sp.]|nr:hypothetical protein [Puia sp.]